MISADGAVVDDDIPRPERDGIPLIRRQLDRFRIAG